MDIFSVSLVSPSPKASKMAGQNGFIDLKKLKGPGSGTSFQPSDDVQPIFAPGDLRVMTKSCINPGFQGIIPQLSNLLPHPTSAQPEKQSTKKLTSNTEQPSQTSTEGPTLPLTVVEDADQFGLELRKDTSKAFSFEYNLKSDVSVPISKYIEGTVKYTTKEMVQDLARLDKSTTGCILDETSKSPENSEEQSAELTVIAESPKKGKRKAEDTEYGETTQSPKKRHKKAAKETADGEPPAKKSKSAKAEEKTKLRKAVSLTKGMDFSHDCQTKDGRKPNWKIASWNINGIRAWMDKGGLSYIADEKPDILCVQETKCAQEELPAEVKVDGYHDYWSSAEQAGYAGTGIYSKTKPINVTYGLGIKKHDSEGRVITAEYEKFFLVTAYVPNSGHGLPRLPYRSKEWDVDFREYLNNLNKTKPVIMCGDLNVAHLEIDLANPKTNKKTAGFTAEERQGFTDLLAEGYIDSYRELYPETEGAYSFWTYMGNARAKNVGWRLDYFVLSERLKEDLCDNVIRKDVMGSDHCPIVLYMALKE